MRVHVVGKNPCAVAVRSDLARIGPLVVTPYAPAFTVVIEEEDGLACPVVDGVDSEIERRVVYHLGEACQAGLHLQRFGGNRSDSEIRIRVAPEEPQRHAVEIALRRALSEIAQGKPLKKRRWNLGNAAGFFGFLVFLAVLLLVPAPLAPAPLAPDSLSSQPLFQTSRSPPRSLLFQTARGVLTVQFWDGLNIIRAGDSVNNAVRVNCIIGCAGGGGGGTSSNLRRRLPGNGHGGRLQRRDQHAGGPRIRPRLRGRDAVRSGSQSPQDRQWRLRGSWHVHGSLPC